jgi:hypothetical protein
MRFGVLTVPSERKLSALVSAKEHAQGFVGNAAQKFSIVLTDSTKVVVVDANSRSAVDALVNHAGGKISPEQTGVSAVESLVQNHIGPSLIGEPKGQPYRDNEPAQIVAYLNVGLHDRAGHVRVERLVRFHIGVSHV